MKTACLVISYSIDMFLNMNPPKTPKDRAEPENESRRSTRPRFCASASSAPTSQVCEVDLASKARQLAKTSEGTSLWIIGVP